MRGKRTEQVSVRVTPELSEILVEEARKLDWTKAKLAERILADWAEHRYENGGAFGFLAGLVDAQNAYDHKNERKADEREEGGEHNDTCG